jgi:hypothetical protein
MSSTKNYDLDIDTTLGGNSASDYIIPSQKAIKSYVDNHIPTIDQAYNPASTNAQSGTAVANALSTYQLIAQSMTALSASGTIALSDNSINKISATGSVTFTLPTITDLTVFHQIFVQLKMATAQTINLATTYYFNSTAPDLSTAGTYNLIYEYDNTASHWVVGALGKGASA